MARKKLRARVFIEINGEQKLWYEIDENGAVTWHLPKDTGKQIKNKILKNVGSNMSRYIIENPQSSLWG